MKNKRTLLLVFATLATIILAVIAVVTSMKLKEVATVPIAPTAPVSQPKAAIPEEESPLVCATSISVAGLVCGDACTSTNDCETGQFCDADRTPAVCTKQECTGEEDPCNCAGSVSCTAKEAFKDTVTNKAGTYAFTEKLTAGSDVSQDQAVVYRISYKNTKAAALTGVTVTDVIPADTTFVDAETGCAYAATSRTITCTIGSLAGNATGTKAFRVKIDKDAVEGELTNKATVKAGTETSSCSISLNINVPEPGEPPACNDYCANDSECPSDLKCVGNKCRNPECNTDSDCACDKKPGCNESCSADSDCAGGYICDTDTNKCRNSACTGETDCTCPTTTTTSAPPPEKLPEAGAVLPTVAFLGVGGLLLILGVLLAGHL